MDNQEFKNFKEKNKTLFAVLLLILNVFLAVLIISTAVGIQNKFFS